MKLVYSDKYQVDIGLHVFPTQKYKLIKDSLISHYNFPTSCLIDAPCPSDEDILLVHTEDYVKKLKTGLLSQQDILTLELPYSKELVEASWLCVGGTIQSCMHAIEDGVGIHLGGGFHHAFADHGEGFCVLNDIGVAITKLIKQEKIFRPLVIDCDVHQGNGTAHIFKDEAEVYTFSIHQRDNYPFVKMQSDLDVDLEDGVGDDEYMQDLEKALIKIRECHKPDFIIYVAGADPFCEDVLGGLNLSLCGLKRRDEFVFDLCKRYNIPCAVVFGGGYAQDVSKTVKIHLNTILAALDILDI